MKIISHHAVIGNTIFRWTGEIVNKAVWFFFLVLLARKLGAVEFGWFNYAFSWASLLVLFTDLGTNVYLMRDVSRDPSRSVYLLSNILLIKGILSAVVLVAALFVPKENTALAGVVFLFTCTLIISSFLDPFNALYRARKEMYRETIVMLVWRLMLSISGIVALYALNGGLTGVAFALMAGSTVTVTMTVFVAIRAYGPLLRMSVIDTGNWLPIMRGSVILGILMLINGVFYKFNVIVLQHLGEAEMVGWYSAAFKIVEGSMFIPSIFIGSVFPVLCTHNVNGALSPNGRHLVYKSLGILLVLAVVVSVTIASMATYIIPLLFGREFLPAIPVLRILGWSMLFIFINEFFIFFFLSMNRQRSVLKIMGAGLFVYALLCIVLIPRSGHLGAAWVIILTSAFLTMLHTALFLRIRT